MNKYELTEDFAKYYLSVSDSKTMCATDEDVVNWLQDFKNILTNADDPLVKHIVRFAPDCYFEFKEQEEDL